MSEEWPRGPFLAHFELFCGCSESFKQSFRNFFFALFDSVEDVVSTDAQRYHLHRVAFCFRTCDFLERVFELRLSRFVFVVQPEPVDVFVRTRGFAVGSGESCF